MSRRMLSGFALCLLAAPPVVLLVMLAVGWIAPETGHHAGTGIAITAAGGLATGIISERYLRRGRNGTEQMAGVIAATAVSVTTIGILYLLHIRGPMASISTFDRAVKQLFPFAEFLTAQGAGILGSIAHTRRT